MSEETPFFLGAHGHSYPAAPKGRSKAPIILCGGMTVFFAVAGGLLLGLLPKMIHDGIDTAFRIEGPTSSPYKSFQNSHKYDNIELKYSYYIYNCTNADEVEKGLAQPNLVEIGPYTFTTNKIRPEEFIRWRPDATVEYMWDYHYEFRRDLSVGDLTDPIVLPSIPWYIFMYKLQNYFPDDISVLLLDPSAEEIVKALGKDMTFFQSFTVNDLYEGMSAPFVKNLQDMEAKDGNTTNTLAKIKAFLEGMVLEKAFPFSVVKSANATAGGKADNVDIAYTGGDASPTQPAPPARSYMTLKKWHNMESLECREMGLGKPVPYWGDKWANMINGTDGSVAAPFLKKGQRLPVFVDDLYRSVALEHAATPKFHGLDLYRYQLPNEALEPASENPANAAFNMWQRGWLEMPKCLSYPMAFTQARYLETDQTSVHCNIKYLGAPEAARTHLDFDPLTGSLVNVAKRLQFNIQLHNFTYKNCTGWPWVPCHEQPYEFTRHINATKYPVFWLDEHTSLPKKLIDDIKRLYMLLALGKYLGAALLVLAGLSLFSMVGLIFRYRRRPAYTYNNTPSTVNTSMPVRPSYDTA